MTTVTSSHLNQDYKEIVKATVPVLQERGADITKRFYQLLFEKHPELKNIFNQTNQRKGDQPVALANMVYAAAVHIDNLAEIVPQVMPVAHKHTSLNIKPEYYPLVGESLLLAMREVLGADVATDEVIGAWEKAYGEIAAAFIGIEKEMYEENVKKGGWTDYKDFKVVSKVKESDVITSFYLKPVDGDKLPSFKPGQYITIKASIDGHDYTHQRQYSLSCAPNENMYRISVKREDAMGDNPAGIVSTYMHQQVEEGSVLSISCPSGDFILDMNDNRPLVLISGGVGLTPMMSMLESALIWQPEREVVFLHAARSGNFHAMKERLKEVTTACKQVTSYTIYDSPTEADAGQFDKEGYIDTDFLKKVLPTTDAAYYFCGPKGFMRAMYQNLKSLDVAEDDIHFEIFGPATDIKN